MGRITGAAVPITFSDGKSYEFSPLTDRDIDELDEWVQARIIDMARKSLPPTATLRDREETISLAIREAAQTSISNNLQVLSSVRGLARVAYYSIRKRHSDVTEEYIRSLFAEDRENIDRVTVAFHRANALTGIETNGEADSSKKAESEAQ